MICGTVRGIPKRNPELASRMLFGPGVIAMTNQKAATDRAQVIMQPLALVGRTRAYPSTAKTGPATEA
jgi:hypothetical protein